MAVWTAAEVPPVSLARMSPLMVAAGLWSTRVTVACVSTWVTVATSATRCFWTVPTSRSRIVSGPSMASGSTRTKTGVTPVWPSRVGRMGVWPRSRLRISWATWTVVEPTARALSGSTSTCSSGASSDRSFWTLTMPSMSPTAAVISVGGGMEGGLVLAGDDDLQAVAAARHGAGADGVAVGRDRRQGVEELLGLGVEVGAGRQVDDDRGRAGAAAEERLEGGGVGVGRAGQGRLVRLDVGILGDDRLGLDGPLRASPRRSSRAAA